MKRFRCASVERDCTWSVHAWSECEVIERATVHLRRVHGREFNSHAMILRLRERITPHAGVPVTLRSRRAVRQRAAPFGANPDSASRI